MEIILFDLSSVVSALAILSHLCLQMFLFTTSVQYAEYITLMANLIFPFSIAAPSLSAHSFNYYYCLVSILNLYLANYFFRILTLRYTSLLNFKLQM